MNISKLAAVVAAAAITFGVGATVAAPAGATDNIKPFGDQARVIDNMGNSLIGYTVTDFGPSSADVPHNGQLYSATLKVQAYGVWANPRMSGFMARAQSGQGYPLLADSFDGSQVAPDTSQTGVLFFDVVGDVPNSVTWNDGLRDIIAWVPGPSNGGNQA